MRKQRGVARALLAELDRIDTELARMKEAGLIPWTGKPPVQAPIIHRWIEGLIAQIADEAPDVVAGFMRLEIGLVTLAQTADRARMSSHDVSVAFERFKDLESRRRVEFDRGRYDPATERFTPPSSPNDFEEIPDEAGHLASVASADASLKSQCAAAKLAWAGARQRAMRDLDDYQSEPLQSMSILLALEERLYLISRRTIPTLPNLALKSAFPLPEDTQETQLADRRAFEEFRHGKRQF